MNNNSAPAGGASPRPRAFQTIVYGGLAVGVLDILDAMIFFGIRNGVRPMRVFHSVASGLIGRNAAVGGGLKTAVLGGLLHFSIAFIIATVFYFASRLLPFLIRQAILWGVIYGIAAYFVMTYIVVPLSAFPPRMTPIPWAVFLNGIIGHALLVGLPVALIARWSARARA